MLYFPQTCLFVKFYTPASKSPNFLQVPFRLRETIKEEKTVIT